MHESWVLSNPKPYSPTLGPETGQNQSIPKLKIQFKTSESVQKPKLNDEKSRSILLSSEPTSKDLNPKPQAQNPRPKPPRHQILHRVGGHHPIHTQLKSEARNTRHLKHQTLQTPNPQTPHCRLDNTIQVLMAATALAAASTLALMSLKLALAKLAPLAMRLFAGAATALAPLAASAGDATGRIASFLSARYG